MKVDSWSWPYSAWPGIQLVDTSILVEIVLQYCCFLPIVVGLES